MQSAYSTGPADWARKLTCYKNCLFMANTVLMKSWLYFILKLKLKLSVFGCILVCIMGLDRMYTTHQPYHTDVHHTLTMYTDVHHMPTMFHRCTPHTIYVTQMYTIYQSYHTDVYHMATMSHRCTPHTNHITLMYTIYQPCHINVYHMSTA